MAYANDPSSYQDPYGGYNPYGYGQSFDNSDPPEPSEDWEDVPNINRRYCRKINKDVVEDEFKHLKMEKLYVLEIMVEYFELNNELIQDILEKIGEKIVLSLKILNLPPCDVTVGERKGDTTTSHLSVESSSAGRPLLADLFQRMFSYVAGLADAANEESEINEVEEETDQDVGEEAEEGGKEKPPNENMTPKESATEDTQNKTRVDVMEGKNVTLMMSGSSMIQTLQAQGVKVIVSRRDVTETEEGPVTETLTLGTAFFGLDKRFHRAVLRRAVTKASFTSPLVGENGELVGEIGVTISFLSLGQGVEIAMTEGANAIMYGKVKLIDEFPPEPVLSIFDPILHPRLAVTLMNMEPPLDLCRTSTEIIQKCLDSNILTPDDDEIPLSSRYNKRTCRWLEISKGLMPKTSRSSLSKVSSVFFNPNTHLLNKESNILTQFCPSSKDADLQDELNFLWRKLKRQCRELGEVKKKIDDERNTLYQELDNLLAQDKVGEWENKTFSERSETSIKEQTSNSTRGSGKTTSLKSTADT